MNELHPSDQTTRFRLRSGAVINAGWLQQDLPFLIRSLRFLLRAESEALRAEAGLEAGDIGVLAVISLNPGITQNDLADSLVLKKSAVTRVVQRLEKRGLIVRQRSKRDRRANNLALTEDGAAMADILRKASRARQATWFGTIPAEKQAVFYQVLFELIATLAEDAEDGAGTHDD
jgi:DNA-binding MarR family transcriptional regulator